MPPRPRRRPVRTCVACGRRADKRELVRIAASPQGVVVDPSGRAAGRGAYVCGSGECTVATLRRGRLEHNLRTKMSDDDWTQLVRSLEALAEEVTSGPSPCHRAGERHDNGAGL